MASDKPDAMNLYYFWVWQYIARNIQFIENRKCLVDTVEGLKREGIMSEHVTLDTVADISKWKECATVLLRSPVQDGLSPRVPTDDEHNKAIQAFNLHGYFAALNYDYCDISKDTISADKIISNINSYSTHFEYPYKKIRTSPYPFQTSRTLLDDTTISGGLFDIRIGQEFHGMRSVAINFSLPIKTIVSEIEAIYELVHGSTGFATNAAIKTIIHSREGVTNFKGRSRDVGPAIGRVLGLWLWEYMDHHKCTQAVAIRALAETENLELLGMENLEDTDLRFYLRRTKACIDAGQVLSFSKKGT